MALVTATHGSTLERISPRLLQHRVPFYAGKEQARPVSYGQNECQPSLSPDFPRQRIEEVRGNETCHDEELLPQDVAAAAQKLWSQYSSRTSRCIVTPGRTPRSVASTTPRSHCPTSARSLLSLPDLHAQAVASSKSLETELAVMSGLIAEVSLRRCAPTDSGSAPRASSRSSKGLSQSASLAPSPTSSLSRQAKVVQGEPAAAEAAHGRRTSAPVGARHRPQKRDELTQHLEEVQTMHRRVSMALTSTENLISGLQELRAQRRKAADNESRTSLSPRSNGTRASSRREAVQCRPDNRVTALQRSLCIRMKDSEELCKEAQSVCGRVLHALTVAKDAQVDGCKKVACFDENSSTNRGVFRKKSFSPPSRRHPKAIVD